MDENNVRNLKKIFSGDRENKIKKLLDFLPAGGDIADPWYYGNFDVTYSQIKNGCRALLEKMDNCV